MTATRKQHSLTQPYLSMWCTYFEGQIGDSLPSKHDIDLFCSYDERTLGNIRYMIRGAYISDSQSCSRCQLLSFAHLALVVESHDSIQSITQKRQHVDLRCSIQLHCVLQVHHCRPTFLARWCVCKIWCFTDMALDQTIWLRRVRRMDWKNFAVAHLCDCCGWPAVQIQISQKYFCGAKSEQHKRSLLAYSFLIKF